MPVRVGRATREDEATTGGLGVKIGAGSTSTSRDWAGGMIGGMLAIPLALLAASYRQHRSKDYSVLLDQDTGDLKHSQYLGSPEIADENLTRYPRPGMQYHTR